MQLNRNCQLCKERDETLKLYAYPRIKRVQAYLLLCEKENSQKIVKEIEF